HQNVEVAEGLQVFIDGTHATGQFFVITRGDLQEFDTAVAEFLYRCNDVIRGQGEVLHAGAMVKVQVFFDLRLFSSFGRFVNGEFDVTAAVGHHFGHQGRVFRRDVFVVKCDQ